MTTVAPAPPPAAEATPVRARVSIDGKFFRSGREKFYVKGLTYGPFAPDANGETFGTREQVVRDLEQIRTLGVNTLRVYYVPPKWFLDRAAEAGLRVFVDIPWPKHLCFLDEPEVREQARQAVRDAVTTCAGHPAVFAYSVVNEVPAEIARWSGPRRIEQFIEELVDLAKGIDPGCLCTFASYPPTEFLRPQNIDFLCFNVYLHHRPAFEAYLSRLQNLADARPLLLGEVGMDSWREGEEAKCAFLQWQIEAAFLQGLAGMVVFSYTDEWFRGGHEIEDWSFGLTTRDRAPKASFDAVRQAYQVAPHFPLPRTPRVSVVIASYNGARTLKTCLESLTHLRYPDYEVILVDDGSTDNTQSIAENFPQVRVIRQANLGLSAARNTGIVAATGEIVAFTDSDCRADEDWLFYIVGDLLRSDFAGIGGHNFLPPEDSPTAAAVMASPGGPAHVMLTDREAEHIPGCNMAFYKTALEQIGGFDPIFRKAGDDVDVCWRLQNEDCRLGFSPGGFVWHYRRSTVKAYLRQQAGYGEAEAMLAQKHPEFFNALGGSIWKGRIYAQSGIGGVASRPVIYHGLFGSGAFQKLYCSKPATALMLLTSLQWHLVSTLPLLALSLHFGALAPLPLAAFGISIGVCVASAWQTELPSRQRRWWSRPLVATLSFLQPLVRGWARYRSTWSDAPPSSAREPEVASVGPAAEGREKFILWAERVPLDRYAFLDELLAILRQRRIQVRLGTAWSDYDLETAISTWSRLRFYTVTEEFNKDRVALRCRLRTAWTLRAGLVFGLTAAVVALATALAASQSQWVWYLPLLLPGLYLFFENESRRLRRLVGGTVVELAAGKGYILVRPFVSGKSAEPAGEVVAAVSPAP